jgi:integrase
LRDRAILSVGLQAGLRRAEIAALKVGDLHQNRGYDSLRVVRKGGRRDALAIHPHTAQRIRAYLALAGHGDDLEGPLFRHLSRNRKMQEGRRPMHPDAIDRVLRKPPAQLGWIGGILRIRCARLSSRRRWKTARRWRKCKRRPVTVIRAPRNSTTGAATIPRSRHPTVQTIESL